jgi:hypothetical protein
MNARRKRFLILLGLLLIFVGLSINAEITHNTDWVTSPASGIYGGSQFDWGDEEEFSIVFYYGPDSLYQSGSYLTDDQESVKNGDSYFIDKEMPLDIVLAIRPINHPLTLYSGGDSKTFIDLLEIDDLNGNIRQFNSIPNSVISVRLPPEETKTSWNEAIREKKAVVLQPQQRVFVRIRLLPKKASSQLKIAFRYRLDEIAGNEKLKEFLLKTGNRFGVGTDYLLARIIDQKTLQNNTRVETDYLNWRITHNKFENPRGWQENLEQRAIIEVSYDRLRILQPKDERLCLNYAKDFEIMKKYEKALVALKNLDILVQEGQGINQILGIAPGDNIGETFFGSYNEFNANKINKEKRKDDIKKAITRHVNRLEKLQKEKEEKDKK